MPARITLLPRALARAPRTAAVRRTPAARPFTSGRATAFPRKDTQDKDSMNTTSTEYSKSGGDAAAAQEPAAFDPNSTTPEGAEAASEAGKGKNNPLNVSPANHEISQPRPAQEGGAERSANEAKGERKVSGQGNEVKSGGKAGGSK